MNEPATQSSAAAYRALLHEAQARVDLLACMPTERRVGGRRGALCVAVFVGALVLASTVLGRTLEWLAPGSHLERDSVERRKWEYFAAHKDEYDMVFVGTSRVYRQFVPGVFREELERAGRPLQGFNFGLRGLRHPEGRDLVSRILDQEPARLRYLFVELTGDLVHAVRDMELHEENPFSRRVIHWHSPATTWLVIRAALRSDLTPAKQREAVLTHLHHLAYHLFQLGDLVPALRALLGLDRVEPSPIEEDHGHWSCDAQLADDPESQIRVSEKPALRRRVQTALEWLDAPPMDPDPELLRSLRELVAEARAHDVEPVFVVMPPHWREGVEMIHRRRRFGLPVVLSYQDPREFPQYYQYENLFNLNHLNERTSVDFTRQLAADFLSYLEQGAPPDSKD